MRIFPLTHRRHPSSKQRGLQRTKTLAMKKELSLLIKELGLVEIADETLGNYIFNEVNEGFNIVSESDSDLIETIAGFPAGQEL